MNGVVEKYQALDVSKIKTHMPLGDAEALSVALAERISALRPDLIVGLANGALLPTRIVADQLGVPFEVVRIRREGGKLKARLLAILSVIPFADAAIRWGPIRGFAFTVERAIFGGKYTRYETPTETFGFEVVDKTVAIIDDCMVTGGSVRLIEQRLLAAGARAISINVLCWTEQAAEDRSATPEPANWLHRFVHFYPWSGNSLDRAEYHRWLQRHGMTTWK